MPASVRRYCPVIVQVHSLCVLFISFILNKRRAPLKPRVGYIPGEEAVKRMNRQLSKEVTTIVVQVVMNA